MKPTIKMQKDTLKMQKNAEYKPLNQSYVERDKLYKTTRWRMMRRKHLERYPDCVRCGKPADTVDHSKTHNLQPDVFGKTWRDYFFEAEYLVSYCHSCHSRKSMLVDAKNKPKRLTPAEKKEMLTKLN